MASELGVSHPMLYNMTYPTRLFYLFKARQLLLYSEHLRHETVNPTKPYDYDNYGRPLWVLRYTVSVYSHVILTNFRRYFFSFNYNSTIGNRYNTK